MMLAFTISRAATCRKCGALYDATEAQTRRSDFICKPCKAAVDRANRELRKERGERVSGRNLGREYHQDYNREYTKRPEVRERRRMESQRRWRDPQERDKWQTRRATRDAIKAGTLVRQPCEVCGALKVDAHHDDYSRPLSVRWLCRLHHAEHHAKARGEQA